MSVTPEMLFQMQRFHILALYTSNSAQRSFTDSYVYAWSEEVFPFLDESAAWHKPYEKQFKIGKEKVETVFTLLANRWDAKNYISFYQLEDHFDTRSGHTGWSRSDLLRICRYLYLHGIYDPPFWAALLKNGECPSEALSLNREMDADQIYFL